MNSREKFLATMQFRRGVPPNKWEFGYWATTLEQWYAEGLPRKHYPRIPTGIVNTTCSLYSAVWTHEWGKNKSLFETIFRQPERELKMPNGLPVTGGGIYWPTQGLPLDADVKAFFNFQKGHAS